MGLSPLPKRCIARDKFRRKQSEPPLPFYPLRSFLLAAFASKGNSSPARITTFNGRYKDGVSTITFCGREVKLADSARKVILGNKTINLANESPTVTVIARGD